jgi:PhzF family phenazine biosynthesis protein
MTSAAHFFWIDAFAEAPFAGNPAAVCLLEHELSDAMQQDLAAEFNLSETVFLMRLGDDFAIRWFTPTLEVPLVGHATLAAVRAVDLRLAARREAMPSSCRLTRQRHARYLPTSWKGSGECRSLCGGGGTILRSSMTRMR